MVVYYVSYHMNDMKEYFLDVEIMGKPRMVRSDTWANRDVVNRYWSVKDKLVEEAQKHNLLDLPDDFYVEFHIPMPTSWSEKKKILMNGQPHQVKPDIDNLLKTLLDCLKEKDQTVWHVDKYKYWSRTGKVIIKY